MSFRKVAAQLGVTAPTVQHWVRNADAAVAVAVEEVAVEDKAEIARLQKELRWTQQERDILNRAVAFFAKESSATT